MKIDFNQWGPETTDSKEIDFTAVKSICNNNIVTILEHYQPGGRVVNGEYICATKYGGKGESCSTNIRTGVGADFGAGESWGDLIDLVAQIDDISMSESARRLQSFFSGGSVDCRPTPIIPQQSPEERYEYGQKVALDMWVESEQCPAQHPYLIKKQINPDSGIRLHQPTGNILVPLYDEHGVFWAVQRISPDGDKKINHCGKLSGSFYLIGGERDIVYVCEGYATAQTVAMATGKTAVMAVSAGNMVTIAAKISAMFPSCHLVFAADNDQKPDTDENPGIKAATNAVKQIGRGVVIAPPFPAGQKGDWNDFAIIHGGKATRELLTANKRSQVFVDIKTVALTEPAFLIEDAIETPCTGMVFGPSGGGKSFFVLDMLFHIACGKKWLGKQVKQGPAFYVCGEGRHAIPRRLKAWETSHKTQLPYNSFLMSSARVDFSPESVRDMVMEIDHLESVTGPPAIIVVDTMARALPGDADENSSKDVGSFIDECDRLQQKYNCVVMIVHHTGHADSASKRARGSSAIKGAMDVEILITKDRTVEWTKTKDMEPHPPIKFELVTVQYGDGKREHSCVLKYDLDYVKNKGVSGNRIKAMDALHEAIKADGLSGDKCLEHTWREAYYRRQEGVKPRAMQDSFRMQKEELSNDNVICIDNKVITVLQANAIQDRVTDEMFKSLKP